MFKGVQFLTINKLKLGDLSLNIYHIMLYIYVQINTVDTQSKAKAHSF